MKLAVITPTYHRQNGMSKLYLAQLFEVLYKQEYSDFKLFLIGDCYANKGEFNEICKSYKKDIFFTNLDVHYRADTFSIPLNKWASGGCNAIYFGIKQAIQEGYEYYLHLDDDEIWETNHISEMVDTIKRFPNVSFIGSCSQYMIKRILPAEHKTVTQKEYNNFCVRPKNMVHSVFCINLKTLGNFTLKLFETRFEIINNIKNKTIAEYELSPFDAYCLEEYARLQQKGEITCILNPAITCRKQTDLNIPN